MNENGSSHYTISGKRVIPIDNYESSSLIEYVKVGDEFTTIKYRDGIRRLNRKIFPNRIYLIIEGGKLKVLAKNLFDASFVKKAIPQLEEISKLEKEILESEKGINKRKSSRSQSLESITPSL